MHLLVEVRRKFIHFLAILIPIFYAKEEEKLRFLILLFLVLFGLLLIEFFRFQNLRFNVRLLKMLGGITRKEERTSLSGATYLLTSALLVIFFYEKNIAISSLLFVIVGDNVAALVGKKWGRVRLFNKTLEGMLACFIICLALGWLLLDFKLALIGSLVAALIEVLPLPVNDNLIVPLSAGLVMKIVTVF
jgi:dolichol kinase